MHLSDILNEARLAELVAGHYISRVEAPDGRHVLYNYTEKATFERVWGPETTACRGLVVDRAGRIVALGFDKFHNLNEFGAPDASLEAVVARGEGYEVWGKLDGSMVLLWWDGQTWRTTTRGSFTSTQARDARVWLSTHVNTWHLDADLCYIGEWIGPGNRVVLPYARDEWRLIGVRSLVDGRDFDRSALFAAARDLGVEPALQYLARSLAEVLESAQTHTGIEGWVLRWPDGFRVKVKTSEYLALHRLVTNLTPARIHEALCAGTYDDYARRLPEEFRAEADAIAGDIRGAAAAVCEEARETFARLRPLLADGRKAFALAANECGAVRPYLFMLADGKPIEAKVLAAWEPLS